MIVCQLRKRIIINDFYKYIREKINLCILQKIEQDKEQLILFILAGFTKFDIMTEVTNFTYTIIKIIENND